MTTVVVGGGLGGALAARALDLAGEEVVVLEAEEEPGGVARAVEVDGYLLEPAVGTLMLPNPVLERLLDGLDLEVRAAPPTARRRFIRHRGLTVEVRPGPGLLTSPLASPMGKLRAMAEPFVSAGIGDESLEGFLVRRLGKEAGGLAAWLMAGGVHAGDPAALSVEAAFPALSHLEREHGSLLRGVLTNGRKGRPRPTTHVVTGGTAGLARAVAAKLGERWRNSWRASRLEPDGGGWRVHGPEDIAAERVVAAVSPAVMAELYPPLFPDPEPAPWAPVAVVWLGLAAPQLPEGFGVLIGPGEGFVTLGFLYESAYAPERAPAGRGLVKAIVGGATDPAAVDVGDDELEERVADELSRVLGSEVVVDMRHVVRHDPGIPQYTAGRRHMLARLRESLPPGLGVCGWAYDGVGVSHLATAAHHLATP